MRSQSIAHPVSEKQADGKTREHTDRSKKSESHGDRSSWRRAERSEIAV